MYFNYFFTAIWVLDVIRRWRVPRKLPRWIMIPLHTFMALMVFNGTVVFGTGMIRWMGGAATLGLSALWLRRVIHH